MRIYCHKVENSVPIIIDEYRNGKIIEHTYWAREW